MPEYPVVKTELIVKFFIEKGFANPDTEPFLFSSPNPYPPIAIVDNESEWIDLNHLVQDWTTQGAGQLAEELIE